MLTKTVLPRKHECVLELLAPSVGPPRDADQMRRYFVIGGGVGLVTCFTGEKFTTGQERFAPQYPIWGCSATPPAMKQINIKDRW